MELSHGTLHSFYVILQRVQSLSFPAAPLGETLLTILAKVLLFILFSSVVFCTIQQSQAFKITSVSIWHSLHQPLMASIATAVETPGLTRSALALLEARALLGDNFVLNETLKVLSLTGYLLCRPRSHSFSITCTP